MKPFDALAAVFLVFPQSLAAQGAQARKVAPPEFQAECTLTPELVDQIVADLTSEERRREARALLEEHEIEHGWAKGLPVRDFVEPDFVDAAHAVRCSDGVLERMAALRSLRKQVSVFDLQLPFAVALQRGGRLNQALVVLDSAIAAVKDERGMLGTRRASRDKSFLNEFAASLCAREGKSELAFEYAKHWESTSDCGNCAAGERSRIQTFRARQLANLGRAEEVLAIGREMLGSRWGRPSATLIALYIDCESASRSSPPGLSGLSSDLTLDDWFRSGKRLRELQHASRDVQLGNLSEIAGLDADLAYSLAFGFDNHVVDEHLDAFDVVDGKLRDRALVCVLARTGNPILQSPLERAAQALGRDLEFVRQDWDAAHARWVALSRPR